MDPQCRILPDRLARASSDNARMFLKGSNAVAQTFDIGGERGEVYTVTLAPAVSCTCMDFKLRQHPCKHLCWLALRVMKVPLLPTPCTWQQLVSQQSSTPPVHSAEQLEVDRLNNIIDRICADFPSWKKPALDTSTICIICRATIVPLTQGDRVHWCRFQCGVPIHESCGLQLVNSDCPNCRNSQFYMNSNRFGHTNA